jgi:hypothetical protein
MASAESAVAESSRHQVASPCRGAHLASARRRIYTRRIEEMNLVEPEACAHTVHSSFKPCRPANERRPPEDCQ